MTNSMDDLHDFHIDRGVIVGLRTPACTQEDTARRTDEFRHRMTKRVLLSEAERRWTMVHPVELVAAGYRPVTNDLWAYDKPSTT